MTNAYLDKTDAFMASLGVETYRVGGSVRDELLGRKVKDADYMVRGMAMGGLRELLSQALHAYGDEKSSLKPLNLRTGAQGGWRIAARGLGSIEIMLPRTDISTGPSHGDFDIVINPDLSLEDDALRRDFTFNALYKIVHVPSGLSTSTTAPDGTAVENVLDPTGRGLYDLAHRLVSTTYAHSFRDDPLRTLRALRFVATLGYDLATETGKQMRSHAPAVDGLSANGYASGTVLEELSRILMGADAAKALRLAASTGVLGNLFPELEPMLGFEQESKYHDLTTDEHTFKALERAAHVDAPLRVRMALLFHDSGKPKSAWMDENGNKHFYAPSDAQWLRSLLLTGRLANNMDDTEQPPIPEDHEVISERLWRSAAARMNTPTVLREEVATLIRNHMVGLEGKFKPSKVRQARVKFGDEMLHDLLLHRACDISGKEARVNARFMYRLAEMESARHQAEVSGVPVVPTDLAIGGKDWSELGLKGRQIGEVQRALLHEVASAPSETKLSREWQLKRAADLG